MLPKHILRRATRKAFDYDPAELPPSSCRPVVARCTVCKTERIKPFRYAVAQPSCQTCANKARAVSSASLRSKKMKEFFANGGVHGMAGKVHSTTTRALLRSQQLGRKHSVETKAKVSAALRRRGPVSKETRQKLRLAHLGKKSARYGKPPAHGKKVWVVNAQGHRVCMRSSWEAAFANHLTADGHDWSYESQSFPVTVDGVDATYTPDFWVPDHHCWYEVKGRWLDSARKKFLAFKKRYPKKRIVVADRTFLTKLGLLPK